MFKTKKAQSGLITGLVFGIALLVIGVIIAFVVVSTLTNANLLNDIRITSSAVNETDAWINQTTYQLTGLNANYVPGTIAISTAFNFTSGLPILNLVGNITVNSTGSVRNITTAHFLNVSMVYTSSIYSDEELSTQGLSGNFTLGVNEVSSKLPTILLVAAIVLILGVLVLLVGAWQRMRVGGGGI